MFIYTCPHLGVNPAITFPHKPYTILFLARNLSIMLPATNTSHLQSTKCKSKKFFVLNLHLLFSIIVLKT